MRIERYIRIGNVSDKKVSPPPGRSGFLVLHLLRAYALLLSSA